MNRSTSDDILARIEKAGELYHRLVLVAGPSGSGKTRVLRHFAERLGFPVVNVNLEVSERLLELTERQRRLELPVILDDIVGDAGAIAFLDNTEVLFDMALQHDPLRLLRGLSRNRTVVASWNGEAEEGFLVYGTPGHPEYRRYPVDDLVVVRTAEALQ